MPRERTVKEIRDLVKAKLGKHACWLQIKIMLALNANKDVGVHYAAHMVGRSHISYT